MKKSHTMRIATALCLVLLLTTSIIGGTLAKYTTQDAADEAARVAKWGVELQIGGNLYGDSYADVIVKDSATSVTVQSLNKSDDVVAPGTQNVEGFTFSLKGQPEVDGSVTTTMKVQNIFLAAGDWGIMIPVDSGLITEANFDEFAEQGLYVGNAGTYTQATAYSSSATYYTLEDAATISANYYPVVYTLAGNTNYTGTDADNTLVEAANALATAMGLTAGEAAADTSITYTGTKTFAANDDLADWKVDGLTLTWAWAFSDGTAGDTAVEHDLADTILGLLESETEGDVVKLSNGSYIQPVEYTDYCLDTCFDIGMVATQAD